MITIKATAEQISALGAISAYPDGALAVDVAFILQCSYGKAYDLLQALVKNGLATREREAEGIVYYPTVDIINEEWEAIL